MIIPALLAFGVAFGARILPGPLTVDDAYIIFRYARNLAEGAGYVYNPGQPVLGTTTPLYTLLLAGLGALGLQDFPKVAWLLNAAFDGGTAALLYVVAARFGGRFAGVAAGFLFALAPMGVAYSAGGMETSLFTFLLVASLAAGLYRRLSLAMALLGLATLVRPEGVMLAGLFLLGATVQRRRVPWRPGLLYGSILIPWVAFAIWWFGTPVPQSVAAKAGVYAVQPLSNLAALVLHAAMPAESLFLLGGSGPEREARAVGATLALPVLVVAAYAGARQIVGRDRLMLVWVLFPAVYVLAYTVAGLRGVRMFHWYLVPLTPFYALLLGTGMAAGARALGRRIGSERPALAGAAGLLAVWWAPGLASGDHIGYPVGFSTERERVYREVAADYAHAWRPNTVVAAPEIGAIGYHTRAEILDTVGLVSPAATAYYPLPRELLASDNAVAPALIMDSQPDYVVSLDQFVRRSLLPDPWFAQNYQLLEARDVSIFDSRHLLVFRRSGL